MHPRCLALLSCLFLLGVPTAHADNGVPRPDHVIIVIEENHSYSEVIATASTPYITSLANTGALMTASYAITQMNGGVVSAIGSGNFMGCLDTKGQINKSWSWRS